MYKRILSALSLSIFAIAPAFAADGGSMSDAERAFLLDQMAASKKIFLESIKGLNETQWHFKPAPEVWSVAECAEHIILAEDFIFNASQGILKTPAVNRLESGTLEHDKMFAMAITDRSRKATAPEPIKPGNKIATPEEAAKTFVEKRDAHMAYVKSSNDELRLHTADGPVGKMDAYQFLVLMASHTARHTAQIKEVEANANYPAK